jgi:hypothetical protein
VGSGRKNFKNRTQTWSLALANTMILDTSTRSAKHWKDGWGGSQLNSAKQLKAMSLLEGDTPRT